MNKKIILIISTAIFLLSTGCVNAFLEVNMTYPDPSLITNVIQNTAFSINATVYCREANCGEVNATARYNITANPDTVISTAQDVPFYTISSNPQTCGVMGVDQFCQLNWTVNATGDVGGSWKIGVLFSNDTLVEQNTTGNATISIIQCPVDFTIYWSAINFATLAPNTNKNPATGNNGNEYNISVNVDSCATDLYLRGANLTNTTMGTQIGIGNVTWSNTTNTYSESYAMTETNSLIKAGIQPVVNITTWYWMNVPPVYAGIYTGIMTIVGVINGQTP
ncbi:MAG: hypothetical protein NT120_01445 [Candidatus Aenigmarchaeota archaeon]|nr:hypothetical protein [Candidatus Aenigmarchaeota archaeon]